MLPAPIVHAKKGKRLELAIEGCCDTLFMLLFWFSIDWCLLVDIRAWLIGVQMLTIYLQNYLHNFWWISDGGGCCWNSDHIESRQCNKTALTTIDFVRSASGKSIAVRQNTFNSLRCAAHPPQSHIRERPNKTANEHLSISRISTVYCVLNVQSFVCGVRVISSIRYL